MAIVHFPAGKLCTDYLNWACSNKACPFAHRRSFSTKFSSSTSWYIVDLDEMQQICYDDPNRKRRVRQGDMRWEYQTSTGAFNEYSVQDDLVIRGRLSNWNIRINSKLMKPMPGGAVRWSGGCMELKMPDHWRARQSGAQLEMVEVSACKEYAAVKLTMERTGAVKVTKVVRVQNYDLMAQYILRKHQKEVSIGRRVKEQMLYHGTGSGNILRILQNGLDCNLPHAGGQCGMGNYFATTCQLASSCNNVYQDGSGSMLLCRVLTGEQQDKTTLVHPIRRPTPGYDSVVNDFNAPNTHVVYYNNEAVPEYLVSFAPNW